jgi:hypothetical protein
MWQYLYYHVLMRLLRSLRSLAKTFRHGLQDRNDIIAGFIQFCKGLLTTVLFSGELFNRKIKFYQNIYAAGQLRQAETAGVVGK